MPKPRSDSGAADLRQLHGLDVARWSAQAPTLSTWRSGQRHRHAAGRALRTFASCTAWTWQWSAQASRCRPDAVASDTGHAAGRGAADLRQLHGLDVAQWSAQASRCRPGAVANDTGTLPAGAAAFALRSFASCTALDVARWSAQAPHCRPGAVASDTGTLPAGRCGSSPAARPGRGAVVSSSAPRCRPGAVASDIGHAADGGAIRKHERSAGACTAHLQEFERG